MSPTPAKLESDFQAKLVNELRVMFPGCYIQKNKPGRLHETGIPDILILWKDRWAILECKRADGSVKQPNQGYYVDQFNEMSFASFIYPENRQEVLDALATAFGA